MAGCSLFSIKSNWYSLINLQGILLTSLFLHLTKIHLCSQWVRYVHYELLRLISTLLHASAIFSLKNILLFSINTFSHLYVYLIIPIIFCGLNHLPCLCSDKGKIVGLQGGWSLSFTEGKDDARIRELEKCSFLNVDWERNQLKSVS